MKQRFPFARMFILALMHRVLNPLLVAVGHNILQQNNRVFLIRNKSWIYSELLYRFQRVVINRYSLIFGVIIVIIIIIIVIIVVIIIIFIIIIIIIIIIISIIIVIIIIIIININIINVIVITLLTNRLRFLYAFTH